MRERKPDLSEASVREIDKKRIHEVYDSWPRLAEEGANVRLALPQKVFSRVVYLGIGGSAAPGDIIGDWLDLQRKVTLVVERGAPRDLELRGTLVVACSASGNTRETIDGAKLAMERGGSLVTISSGGRLEEFARRAGIPHLRITPTVASRYSFPSLLFTTLKVLGTAFVIEGLADEIKDSLLSLSKVRMEIDISSPTESNRSKRLATKIWNYFPKIYGSAVTRGVALRFKNALNENAKKHALFDSTPEVFHNEIEAWEENSERFVALFLRHSRELPSEGRKIDAMIEILRGLKAKVSEESGVGRSALAELLTLTYVLDFASYYVAILNRRDPHPTRLLDRLKRRT